MTQKNQTLPNPALAQHFAALLRLNMKKKLQTLLQELNHGLVERDALLKTALLTVLAGENIVLIGPPGTGKSLIARRIADSFAMETDDGHAAYFEYLLTKFSTPEEIFGPLSISELKADRFKRNTAGYLPAVRVAFLDEIFKASSSILNALLTILNERVYHNGAERQRVPLQALIAASNELPSDQAELGALYDRFLVRAFVDYVSANNRHQLFADTADQPVTARLTLDDLAQIQDAARAVTLPPDIQQAIQKIWLKHQEMFKEDRRESLSDRRLKKVLQLLRVSAASNGRTHVDLSDVFLLKDCLWNHPDNAQQVGEMIRNILQSYSRQVPIHKGVIYVDDTGVAIPAEKIEASSVQPQHSGQMNAVIKGLRGNGTAQDPLLIDTVEEFLDLARPDVGLKGYHFRQTADIDVSAITTWPKISFQGHYDGAGHIIFTIKQHMGIFVASLFDLQNIGGGTGQNNHLLFSDIQEKSSVTNLKLDGLSLTQKAESSYISHCSSTTTLIGGDATNCTISDCLIVGEWQGAEGERKGGIALALYKSVVERCFVTGKARYEGNGYFFFSAIAPNCHQNIIRYCGIGSLLREVPRDVRLFRLTERADSTALEHNACIDSNSYSDSDNAAPCTTVAAAQFKQRYFEHTLGWNFDTVWQWDAQENRPTLRQHAAHTTTASNTPAVPDGKMVDLLTQQIRANIWL